MKLKENRKMQLLFCVLSVALIWGMYAVMATWVEGNVAREKAIAREESFDPKVLLQVENASIEDGKLNISGWVSRYNSELSKVYGVLKAVDGSEEHILKGRLVESAAGNEDLKRVKMEGMESASCFELNVKEQKLKKDVCYEILIDLTYTIQTDDKKREEGEKISTAQYLYNGEVYNYIPTQFHAPEFADEKMKKVVSDGVLRGYDMENGVWIYLYEGSLYWVLNTAVEQNKDEDLYMYFHLYTSQVSLLPENRRKNEFDNKDFLFKSREIEMEADSKYRVAKVTLETEYPITYFDTGHYKNKEKIWSLRAQIIVGE